MPLKATPWRHLLYCYLVSPACWKHFLPPDAIMAHTFCWRISLKLKFSKGGRESLLYKSKTINPDKRQELETWKIFPRCAIYCLAFSIELLWSLSHRQYGQAVKRTGLGVRGVGSSPNSSTYSLTVGLWTKIFHCKMETEGSTRWE